MNLENLHMRFKSIRTHSFTKLALILQMGFLPAAFGEQTAGISELAQKELERREAVVQEGQMLLLKGDEAYAAGKYDEAAAAYAGARESFPNAPATAELRAAATQRYAQATVEHANELVRKGDVQGAKDAVDEVLIEGVAAGDPSVEGYRASLDDPIRTSQPLTKEHAANVDEVRRTLYMAMGAFDLGNFDQANKHYTHILKIDPYNKAARRGMEKIAAQKSQYFNSAYDEARSTILGEIEKAWELPLPPELVLSDLPLSGNDFQPGDLITVSNKLERIIIPKFRIEGGTLMEAIDLLSLRTAENDTLSKDESSKGINIAVNIGDPAVAPASEILSKTFDLNVANVSAIQILKYITQFTQTTYRMDDYAVSIMPVGAGGTTLISRTYRVPPDFLSNLSAGDVTEKEPEDIFNTDIKKGLLTKRRTVQEALARQGVLFPEGASAILNPSTNTLRIINTADNLDVIGQIIDNIVQIEPVAVAVRVTMLRIQEDVLKELSFDWMLDTFQFGGDSWIPGASQMNLTGGTTGNGNPITDIAALPGAIFPTNPITSGNRSGDFAVPENTIDSLISSSSNRGAQERFRAPGVLGVNGIVGSATLQALMRGLDQKKGYDLMAQPSVTTRSGTAASIYLIDEFIYPTEYEPPELPATGGGIGIDIDENGNLVPVEAVAGASIVLPAMPTAFETRDLGIVLTVLPVADEKKQYVNVSLNPSFSEFDGFVNYGSPINSVADGLAGPITTTLAENQILMPIFSVQRVDTNLVVADGATIVIGGLLKEEITKVDDKTPILGDIPMVGRFFKSDAKKHISTAIIFFVNVELLDPTGRPYRDR